jgi:hypothetical protein
MIQFGTKDQIIEGLLKLKELGGYDDFITLLMFDLPGFSGREIEAQMEYFAQEIMPVLERECGGTARDTLAAPATVSASS